MTEQTSTPSHPSEEIRDKISLIIQRVADIIDIERIQERMEKNLPVNGYWGTAPTKSPSIGYLIPLMKIRDMIRADINMTILIADVHSFLDKGPDMIDNTKERVDYYIFLINVILGSLGLNRDQYKIVKGSDYQLSSGYIFDLYRLMTNVSVKQAVKAGSEVVKQSKDQSLGSLVYPLMQTLDESALQSHVELGGIDQRKIFAFSRDFSDMIGKEKCSYLMNEMLPSLTKLNSRDEIAGKMSSSNPQGKIGFLDSTEEIKRKITKAFCSDRIVEDNPCVSLARLIVLPINGKLGPYFEYELFEKDWVRGKISSQQLKEWLSDGVENIISPIRQEIRENIILYEKAFGN